MQAHYIPERKHWVTSSYRAGRVNLYDSCFNGRLTPSLEVQLVQLYRPAIQSSTLLVTAESVQQQNGANDCGLFSIAFAYQVARSMDVTQLQIDQQDMREHLRTPVF